MAGAAIIGILSAVLRLPEVGAPIRHLSIGVDFFYKTKESAAGALTLLEHHKQAWYSGATGQTISLVAFTLLAVFAFLLARKGAQWDLAEAKSRDASDSDA